MLQSTNEPTESRRLKDASFMKVQKMLDEGIVNPLKVLGHHPLCSFLLSRRTFAVVAEKWRGVSLGSEEVEAFNSLKKALTSDPVLGMYDEELLQKSILMQAGTVSELSSTNSE
ncbi:hypothetical protein TNCV_2917691 [Trichonephila clavipes]|nr:hypothetical protein TNCV_2917691 [Trichonephila clavipes]